MSTSYSGAAANIANNLPSALPISSSTAANPTVIASLGAHNLLTGDTVDLFGHQTNTGANGVWPVTVIDSTHFSIPVDTHAGTPGGATGHFQSLAAGPTGPIPSDGDDASAASVNVQFQRLADQTAWLAKSTGYTKVAGQVTLTNPFGPGNTYGAILSSSLPANTWNPVECMASLGVLGADQGCLSPGALGTPSNNCLYSVSGFQPSDLVLVEYETDVNSSVLADYVGLWYAMLPPGAAAPGVFTGMTLAPGSTSVFGSAPSRVRCSTLLANPGSGVLWVAIGYYSVGSGVRVTEFRDDTILRFTALRETFVKQ